jgi:hypothetical protein
LSGFDSFLGWLNAGWTNGLFLVVTGLLGTVVAMPAVLRGQPVFRHDGRLRARLAIWSIAPTDEVTALVGEIRRQWYRTFGAMQGTAGVVLVLAGVGQAMVARLGAGDVLGLGLPPRTATSSGLALFEMAFVVGNGLGYPLGALLVRRSSAAGPAYADLRQRRLDDYRASGFRWLAAAVVAYESAVALGFGLRSSTWSLLVMPVAMLAEFAVVELLMAACAAVPRMSVTADPEVARRCDDLIRSEVVAFLYQLELVVLAIGCGVQASAIAELSRSDLSLRYASLLALAGAAVCLFAAIGTLALEGRLGGRVNGWWGRPMPE